MTVDTQAKAEEGVHWLSMIAAISSISVVGIAIGLGTPLLSVILESRGRDRSDFRLIDSGKGEKLEQYGPYRIVRPEAQALWPRSLPDHVWERADAVFTGDTDEEGMGRWRFPTTGSPSMAAASRPPRNSGRTSALRRVFHPPRVSPRCLRRPHDSCTYP